MGIGDPSQPPPYNAADPRKNDRLHFFAQDTWRVSSRLTLNYGIGWVYESTLTNHDLSKPELLRPVMDSMEPTKRDTNNFSPSVGFAWNVGKDNKTVIRGGGGLYYDTRELSQRLGERAAIGPVGNGRQQIGGQSIPNPLPDIVNPIPGVLPEVRVGTPLDFRILPTGFRLSDLMRILPQVRAEAEAATSNPNPTDLSVRNINLTKQGTDLFFHNYPASYASHLSIDVQRELMKDLVVTADFASRYFFRQEVGSLDHNRFFRLAGPVMPRCTGTQGTQQLANCSLGSIGIRAPIGRSNYNALLVRVEKRMGKRYQLQASYAMANGHGMNGITNMDNWFENWGPSTAKHSLTVSGLVNLPSGIKLAFISSIGSRGPYRPQVNSVDLDGDGTDTAFLPGWNVPDPKPSRERLEAAVKAWTDQYPDLPNGQRPRTGRGQTIPKLTLPATYSFGENFFSQDLRVTKTFTIRERYRVQAFIEGFNIFKVANLGGISNVLNNPAAFGVPTSRAGQAFGSGGPRAFQLGGEVLFLRQG